MAPPNRRNERERNRVKQVNQGFAVLRSHIPSIANTKKLSKVITLRSAVDYIRTLEQLLHHEHPSSFLETSQFNHYAVPNPGHNSAPGFGNGQGLADLPAGYERVERFDRFTLQENAPQIHTSSLSVVDSGASSGTGMSSPTLNTVELQMFADGWHGDWR